MMSRSVIFIFLKYYSFMYLVEVRERIRNKPPPQVNEECIINKQH
jgi:hypothetical protein